MRAGLTRRCVLLYSPLPLFNLIYRTRLRRSTVTLLKPHYPPRLNQYPISLNKIYSSAIAWTPWKERFRCSRKRCLSSGQSWAPGFKMQVSAPQLVPATFPLPTFIALVQASTAWLRHCGINLYHRGPVPETRTWKKPIHIQMA